MSAPRQRCSRLIIYDSNKATVKMLAAYKRCWRPKMLAAGNVGVRKCRRPDSYYLGSAESPLCLLLSPAEELSSQKVLPLRSPPCSPQVESAHRSALLIWAASLPYCTGLLYRHDLPKCSRPSNVRGRGYFDPLF